MEEAVRCEGIYKSFGGVCALAGVSANLPASEITAIIGPNGAGKTTLLNIFTGILRPDDGHCFVGSRETTDLPVHRIARLGIARTFQDLRLIRELSVLDNVLLACPNQRGETLWRAVVRRGVAKEEEKNRRAAEQILEHTGLADKTFELAGELSYGQQKLLAIACCIATNAKILFLDEPVAGVHPELARQVLELLRGLRDLGKTVIFIEHDIDAVRQIAGHLIVMGEGKIIAQGVPQTVLERREIMEAYLG
jgi:ABC-type branched-subunit amino acid transport system ATPase component